MILAGFTLVRLAFILSPTIDLAPDEAQYWDWSRTLQASYYSKPPLIAWWNALWTAIFGPTVFAVRAGAVMGSVLLQGIWWWWSVRVWRQPQMAPWVLLILNTTVFLSAGAVLMTTDNLLLVCLSAAVVLLHRFLRGGGGYMLLAVVLALGILSKYTMLAFVPMAILATWLWKWRFGLAAGAWPRLALALVLGTVVGLFPVILWNISYDWVGIKHVLYRGAVMGKNASRWLRLDSPPEFLASQVALLTPWWTYFLVRGLVPKADLDPEVALLGRVFFWPVFGFFFLWSFHTKIEANWAVSAYVGGVMLVADTFRRFVADFPHKARRVVAVGGAVVLIVYLQAILPVPGPFLARVIGWRDLGEEVGRIMETLDGPTFAFAEEYGVTAELSFYTPGQKRAYCIDTGRKRNQYDLWPGPGPEYTHAVFVMRGIKTTAPSEVQALFAAVGPPQVLTTRRLWVQGQTFTLFVCQGFRGVWPKTQSTTF